ncbi:hypothetical protein [Georgenia sp. MJ170]|uniref:hypothetical protein n=1 Tax=Georgenia sunbinii TaxID=3117728 RepID=UPI002F264446
MITAADADSRCFIGIGLSPRGWAALAVAGTAMPSVRNRHNRTAVARTLALITTTGKVAPTVTVVVPGSRVGGGKGCHVQLRDEGPRR